MRDFLRRIDRSPLLTGEQEVEIARSIEVGLLARERLDRGTDVGGDAPLLYELVSRGEGALERMIRMNFRLVLSIARSSAARNVPYADLMQNGNVGLLGAVMRFDYTKGVKFSTYATWWIRKAISDELGQARMIRLPARVRLEINRVAKQRNDLILKLGRLPDQRELADEIGLTPEELGRLELRTREPSSLNRPIDEEGALELASVVVDPTAVTVEEEVEARQLGSRLAHVLLTLDDLEGAVLRLRYGIGEPEGLPYPGIAEELHLSIAHVRHLERRALAKLSHPSRRALLRSFADQEGTSAARRPARNDSTSPAISRSVVATPKT